MTVLVVGATGATGRLLVKQLLDRGQHVKVIVRAPGRLPDEVKDHPAVSIIHAAVLDLTDGEMQAHVAGCKAMASCLGHTMNLRGIYGAPRRLVTDATRRLCQAVEATRPAPPVDASRPAPPVRFVLMNTTGNSQPDEPISFAERCVLGLVRSLLPPHADNEQAAAYLRDHTDEAAGIEWVAVRPDSLIDKDEVTDYEVHSAPTRSAIFDAGKTNRINVAHFMADLILDDATWDRWKGRMPVIYNKG